MQKAFKFISDILFFSGLLIAGLLLFGQFTGKKPFQVYIVSSGSMEPKIKTGSVVIVSPKTSYRIGDIVTFFSGSDKKATTTHRIVGIDGKVFRSAGDANNQPDMTLIPITKIVGEVRFSIPLLGYLAAFAKTPQGFILLVIVPATIIIYEELKSLLIEIRKACRGLKASIAGGRRQRPGTREAQSQTPNAKILNPAIILPVLFAGFIFLSFSGSFFKDTETSSGNSFTAWIPTAAPSPTPTSIPTQPSGSGSIVINEVYHKGNTDLEWIELYNLSASPINVSGWSITDNSSTDIIPTISDIPSNGYAVIVATPTSVIIPSSAVTITLGSPIGNGLADGGDHIILKNSGDETIDQMSYGGDHSVFNPDPSSTGNNKSISRRPNGTDTNSASDWDSNVAPSIGVANP